MSNSNPKILLIDDEGAFRKKVNDSFGKVYDIINAINSRTALLAVKNNSLKLDLILLDLYLDSPTVLDGLDLIAPLKMHAPNTPVIIITKDKQQKTAILALRLGADDFIHKDEFDIEQTKDLLDKYIQKLPKKNLTTGKRDKKLKFDFIGEDDKIQKIKQYLVKLSEKPDITVLITGESGVGKEVAARYIHQFGVRASEPFIPINLSAITESILESQLFGHKKGAYTGAKTDMKGAFEKADKGILFLDEIGEINQDIQVKLLRFLEDKTIQPIGGNEIKLDVQIVAATNKKLKEAVEDKVFREDLYYRLKQFPIEIPPLRERKRDIPLLIDFYLTMKGSSKDIFTPSAYQKLINYDYPGNVRELVNMVKTILTKVDILGILKVDESILPIEITDSSYRIISLPDTQLSSILPSKQSYSSSFSNEEQIALLGLMPIEEALIKSGGKKGEAAKSLSLSMDNIRYKVETTYKQHPKIFDKLPKIC